MIGPDGTRPEPGSPFKGKKGLRRLANAILYSVAGLRSSYRHEAAFRQEVALACVAVPVALLIPGTGTQKALLVLAVALVLLTELVNCAVEAAVDRISLERHELARRAKDAASAAVLVSLLACGVVWALVLFDVYG